MVVYDYKWPTLATKLYYHCLLYTSPQARVDNNGGIDGKYESMVKSYGRIQDFSAVENIERNNNEDDKEARCV